MFGLKSYTVHIRPDAPHAYQDPVLVKEGFSWLALLMPPLWAFLNRLWVLGLVLLVVLGVLGDSPASVGLTELGAGIVSFTLAVIVGFLAADLRRNWLRRKGYVTADIVVAPDEMTARHRFYERYAAAL